MSACPKCKSEIADSTYCGCGWKRPDPRTKSDNQCVNLINGERCRNGAVFWNVNGTKGHCREHGPL